jgi:hypothetical protein
MTMWIEGLRFLKDELSNIQTMELKRDLFNDEYQIPYIDNDLDLEWI